MPTQASDLWFGMESREDRDPALANPWLRTSTPVGSLTRERLEERILNLLSSQNMCVIATQGSDGPLATPVRYYHLDFELIFTASAGSPKLRNIARDPRVCVGVFAPLVGEARSRGAQIFGTATVLVRGDPGFDRIMSVYRWQSDAAERGESVADEHKPTGPAVVVKADRIVYTEHWLRRTGHAPRQFWTRSPRE